MLTLQSWDALPERLRAGLNVFDTLDIAGPDCPEQPCSDAVFIVCALPDCSRIFNYNQDTTTNNNS